MKKLFVSLSLFSLLLSACQDSEDVPGKIYVVINNGNHFTGLSYVNAISGIDNVGNETTQVITKSIDTMELRGAGSSIDITPDRSYSWQISSYRVVNGSPVPPIYKVDTTVTITAGETKYVTVYPL